MIKIYRQIPFKDLEGETIVKVEHGNAAMPRLRTYQGMTLIAESGREFVVWSGSGEVCLNEIVESTR